MAVGKQIPDCPGRAGWKTEYMSRGQVAFDPRGNVVGRDNMSAQASQVFENIRSGSRRSGCDNG